MSERRRLILNIVICALGVWIISSCSTTRVIPDGSYRLKTSEVIIKNQLKYPDYKVSDIASYVRQKPKGWNPLLYVYNWSSEKDNGWNRFLRKIGQPPVVFDAELVESSKSNMITHLDFLGYYNSSIVDSISAEKKQAKVFYEVMLGKQYPIKEIKYIIADSLLREKYFADTLNSLIKRGAPLSEEALDKESERAAAHFRNDGYYGFSKNYFFFQADTIKVKDSTLLEVRIENYTRNEQEKDGREHRQFYIGDISVYPVYDVVRYRAALARKVPPILDTLKYGDLLVLYDKKLGIRPSVLAAMNRLKKGDLYNESVVNNTYRRFSNLRMYSSVNLQMDQVSQDTVDCNIRLIPSKIQGYKLNLEASSNSTGLIGLSPVISYYHRNIFRGGEWLNLSFMGNFQFGIKSPTRSTELGATANISFPKFLFLPDRIFANALPRTDFVLAYNYQKRPEYTRNMISSSFGYNWHDSSNKFFFKAFPVQINIVKMLNVKSDFYESLRDPFIIDSYKDHFDIGGGMGVSYVSEPSLGSTSSNFKANLALDFAGNLFSAFNKYLPTDPSGKRTIWGSPYSQYLRSELSLVQILVFGAERNNAIAMRLVGGVGYAYGNSNSMPFERLFWAGGANSLRAWQSRAVGPGTVSKDTTFAIANQNGDMRLEANIEYRFPIYKIFRGALFFDAGNVWNIASSGGNPLLGDPQFHWNNFYKTIALNTGVGVRIDIQFIVVRLDLGIKLYEPSEQKWRGTDDWFRRGGYAIQFGIGYPF